MSRRSPPRSDALLYQRSLGSVAVELVGGVGCLGVAVPCLGAAAFVVLHALARACVATPLTATDLARPFAAAEVLGGLVGAVFGLVMARYGLAALLGLALPCEDVVVTVDDKATFKGTRGRGYTVTLGGVTTAASARLYGAVTKGQQVRVERSRFSRSVVRVWRA